MEDYPIVQGQTLLELVFALFLATGTSYAYISCRSYVRRINASRVIGTKTLRLSTEERQKSSSSLSQSARSQECNSSISDWLAPVIVWGAVILTALAMTGILLGEN